MSTDCQADLFADPEGEMSAKTPAGKHRGVNLLNNLSTREWLLSTKSIWYARIDDLRVPALEQITDALRGKLGDEGAEKLLGQTFDSVLLSQTPPRDELKAQHPATFPEPDIEKLIMIW